MALTFASGAIDATSYLGLGRVFTANMTGNLVLLGLAAGRVQGLEALRSGTAFAGYALGVTVASRLLGRDLRSHAWPSRVTAALAVELAPLAALAVGWVLTGGKPVRPWLELLIASSAMAMGVQSAAVQRLAVPSISTTYVTGTVTSLFTELALFGHPATGWPLRAAVITALVAGAGLDALLLLQAPLLAPLLPLLVLAAVTAVSIDLHGRG